MLPARPLSLLFLFLASCAFDSSGQGVTDGLGEDAGAPRPDTDAGTTTRPPDGGSRPDAAPVPDRDSGPGQTVCAVDAGESPCWYDDGWTYRRKITIDKNNVVGSHSHFPIVVHALAPSLRTTGNGGKVGRADGEDIVITASDGQTKLDHEIEIYDGVTGIATFWVKIPQLSQAATKVLYMYYGNPNASAQSNREKVWDDGGNQRFVGVWHMSDNSSSARADATSYANHCNPQNYDGNESSLGVIGLGDHLDGSNDFLSCGTNESFDIRNEVTVSLWLKPTGERLRKDKWYVGPWSNAYQIYLYGQTDQKTTAGAFYRINGSNRDIHNAGETDIPPNSWAHLATTFDGTSIRIYVNGKLDFKVDSPGTLTPDKTIPLTVGATEGGGGLPLKGAIDEARISDTARSAGWLATSFNNQSDPASFAAIGAEVQR